MSKLHLSEPDQHGAVRLMNGETQLAYINPEGIDTLKRLLNQDDVMPTLASNVMRLIDLRKETEKTVKDLIDLVGPLRKAEEEARKYKDLYETTFSSFLRRGEEIEKLNSRITELEMNNSLLEGNLCEFVNDVNSAGYESTEESWPDLAATYGRSVKLLQDLGVPVEDQRPEETRCAGCQELIEGEDETKSTFCGSMHEDCVNTHKEECSVCRNHHA